MGEKQSQDMDRRRALGLIGKSSAAVVVAGATLGATTRDAVRVDLARVRYEFEAGAGSIPLDQLLPDDADAAHLEAARESLRFRVRGIARVLIDRNQSSKEQLLVAKQAMLRTQDEMNRIVDGVVARSMTPAEGRTRAVVGFRDYIEVIRAC